MKALTFNDFNLEKNFCEINIVTVIPDKKHIMPIHFMICKERVCKSKN